MEDFNRPVQALPEDTTMNCYLHNISQVKNATGSQKKYFNCIVQGSDKPVRAVFVSPEKRLELQAIAATKSPVKLKNYKRANSADDNLTITKFTKITPLDQDKISFPYSEELQSACALGNPVSISSVPNLASEQLIFVKAKVLKISGVKFLSTRFGKLKKQDVIIADTTAHIKLVLWSDYVNSLQQDKTYQLKNVRIKSTKYECYLNTPRNEDFKAEEVEPFAGPVAVYEDEVDTSKKVEGVQQAFKSLSCNGCQKRTVEIIDPSKAVCSSCKLMQLPSTCDVSWSLCLLLKPQESHKNIHLRLDSNMTETLVQLVDPTFVLPSTTEDEIIMLILQSNDKSLNFTYDSLNNQVTEIGFW